MDRRELILDATFEALKLVPGILSAYRNRGELPEDKRPAITMLDADERADERAFDKGRLASAPNIMVLRPEIYILLTNKEPKNEGVGQELSVLRREVLKVTLWNNTLKNIVGSNGEIRFEGCSTDMASGRSMQGQMQVHLAFKYPLIPNELVP